MLVLDAKRREYNSEKTAKRRDMNETLVGKTQSGSDYSIQEIRKMTLEQQDLLDQELERQEQMLWQRKIRADAVRKIVDFDDQELEMQATLFECHNRHTEIEYLQFKINSIDAIYWEAREQAALNQDKQMKTHLLDQAKSRRNKQVVPLRKRLEILQKEDKTYITPAKRRNLSLLKRSVDPAPVGSRGRTRANFTDDERQEMFDTIRQLQKEKPAMLDPKMADLQIAELQTQLGHLDKAAKYYEAASEIVVVKKKDARKEERESKKFLEQQRVRRRDAFEKLFHLCLAKNRPKEAADHMSRWLKLAKEKEKLSSFQQLEQILSPNDDMRDPTLRTNDTIAEGIYLHQSIGSLSDLRLGILEVLRNNFPTDAEILEKISQLYVRLHRYSDAAVLLEEVVKLKQRS